MPEVSALGGYMSPISPTVRRRVPAKNRKFRNKAPLACSRHFGKPIAGESAEALPDLIG